MGSVTLYPNADVAIQTNNDYGAGAGPHLPVGVWSGVTYRSAVRFTAPAWNGWTKITKATLNFWISDHQHVGVRNSSILIRRQPTGDMWTRSEGTYSCNSGFSSSNDTHLASDLTSSSTDEVSFSSGTTANAKKSVTVTGIVQAYFAAKTAQPVFLFMHSTTSDYTELWSRSAGSTYDPYLVIEYEDDTVPNAPTLNSPAHGEVVASQNPTLSWTHNDPQGNAQVSAEVSVNGVNVYTVTGSGQSLQVPDVLARGSSYDWLVRTADSLGYGAWSAARSMTIAPYVSPVITKHYLVWANGAVRYRVDWNWVSPDSRYATHHRVTYQSVDGDYDSGWLGGNPGYHISSSHPVTENSDRTNVVIWIRDSFGIESTCSPQTWRARYGVAVHRKDLGAIPVSWGTPTIQATVPAESTLMIQYGSHSTPETSPLGGWYDSLSSVPKLQYLYYALTFLPNASDQSPTLHKMTIPTSNTVETMDHWKLWQGVAFGPPWSLDSGEYVYGTRSVRCDPDTTVGTWNRGLHSELIQLRAGRSYILSGLMKAEGSPGASIVLLSESGAGLASTERVNETRDWFKPDNLDTYRYRTPVYTSPSDQKVYAYAQTDPQPPNSLTIDPEQNGGDTSLWSVTNCTPPHLEDGNGGIPANGQGTFYVSLMEPDGTSTISSRGGAGQGKFAVTQGKRYRARAYVHNSGNLYVGVWYLNAGGGWIETQQVLKTETGWGWVDIDAATPPAGATHLVMGFANGIQSQHWVGFDEMTIYEAYSATAWFDAIKLEESTVATPWSPGAVGASAVDAGGVQIDGSKGAVFRYRGRRGAAADVVSGGQYGLEYNTVEVSGSGDEGVLDVSSRVDNAGAAIRLIGGSSAAQALEFYGGGEARASIWTNQTQYLEMAAVIKPHAAAATGVQVVGTDGSGAPYLMGKIAQGYLTAGEQYSWVGVTVLCRTRYDTDLVTVTINTDNGVGSQPTVTMGVTRLKPGAGNTSRYRVAILMEGDGSFIWKLWGSPMAPWDSMRAYVQAMQGNTVPVNGVTVEYAYDPPPGWIYGGYYKNFDGVTQPG